MPAGVVPDVEPLWRTADLVTFFQNAFTEKTLRNWRCSGIGPPYLKRGGKVFYRPSAVYEWARTTEQGTADSPAGKVA